MRFSSLKLPIVAALVLATAPAFAQSVPKTPVLAKRHSLHLPQSFASLIKMLGKKDFAVSQPLLVSPVALPRTAPLPVVRDASPIGTVVTGTRQGYTPITQAKDEGFNFTGMSHQLPDATRSAAATNTAGVMSWTAKFN